MNTRQKLHQNKLQEWLEHFQNQVVSGLTVKEEYVQSVLPDIVPFSTSRLPVTNHNSTVNNQTLNTSTYPSYNSHNTSNPLFLSSFKIKRKNTFHQTITWRAGYQHIYR